MNKPNIEELFEMHESKMQEFIMTSESLNMSKNIIKKTDELNAMLTEEQQNVLEELLEMEYARGALLDKEIFSYGFSLATQLLIESLNQNS